MKLKSISIYMLSLAGMLGLWSCSTDEAISGGGLVASGEKVPVTITISRGAQTRTELSENTTNGGLNQVWSEGDVVKLYNSNGAEAGTLTLQSGADTPDGIFKGDVKGETGTYRLWYFGKPQADAENPYPYLDFSTTAGQVKLDLQNQNFRSLDELEAVDILSTDVNIVVKNEQGTVGQAVTMAPHVAMARFTISGIPDGTSGTVKIYNNLNSDRGGIYARRSLSLFTGEQQGGNGTTASFTYDGVKNRDDIYVAFLPNPYTLHFEFEASNGAKYTHTFGQNNIEAGVYYRSFNKEDGAETGTIEGIEVPMEVEEAPNNPGNMDNWGGGDEPQGPTYVENGITGKTKNGWCHDGRFMYPDQYFGKVVTYTNGMVNKIATMTYSSGNKFTQYKGTGSALCSNLGGVNHAIYYQWGRSMGFPASVLTLLVNPSWGYQEYQYLSSGNAQAANWLNGLSNYTGKYGYNNTSASGTIWDAFYATVNDQKTEFPINTVAKINDFGIIFFAGSTSKTNRDYYTGNETLNTLESRGGDPCPAGYRMPTAEELEVLIPTGGSFTTSHKEIKNVNGSYYAMQWTVTSAGKNGNFTTLPYVTIKSVKVSASTNIDSVDFSNASAVNLGTFGYLDNNGGAVIQWSDGAYTGLYWTSDYVSLTGRVKYLEIDINGSKVDMEMWDNGSPSWGVCVLPIKDNTATGEGSVIKPLFPLYEIN